MIDEKNNMPKTNTRIITVPVAVILLAGLIGPVMLAIWILFTKSDFNIVTVICSFSLVGLHTIGFRKYILGICKINSLAGRIKSLLKCTVIESAVWILLLILSVGFSDLLYSIAVYIAVCTAFKNGCFLFSYQSPPAKG